MVQLAYTPYWFYGKDIVIDVVGFFVVALIAAFSFRYYRLDRRNVNCLYLSVSFLFLALAFLAKALTNFTIYYEVVERVEIGNAVLTLSQLQSSHLLLAAGFLLYRLLALLGLYLLFIVYNRRQSRSLVMFVMYLLVISTFFSTSAYYVFHLTSLLLLCLVALAMFSRYRSSGNAFTSWLAASFAMLALSQFLFMFIAVGQLAYVLAEVVQLFGFSVLLHTFVRVVRRAKAG